MTTDTPRGGRSSKSRLSNGLEFLMKIVALLGLFGGLVVLSAWSLSQHVPKDGLAPKQPEPPGVWLSRRPIYDASFDHDQQTVLLRVGNEVLLRDLRTGMVLQVFPELTRVVSSVALTPNGQTVIAGGHKGWMEFFSVGLSSESDGSRFPSVHNDAVRFIVVSPDGQWAVSAGGNQMGLWRISSRTLLRRLDLAGEAVEDLQFSPDSRQLLYVGTNGTIRLWNVDGSTDAELPGNYWDGPLKARFVKDGTQVLAVHRGGWLSLWDTQSQTLQWSQPLIGRSRVISALAVSPDGTLAAIADERQAITLVSLATRQVLGYLNGHQQTPCELWFSPDGARLYSAGYDGTVRLWDVPSRQERSCLPEVQGAEIRN